MNCLSATASAFVPQSKTHSAKTFVPSAKTFVPTPAPTLIAPALIAPALSPAIIAPALSPAIVAPTLAPTPALIAPTLTVAPTLTSPTPALIATPVSPPVSSSHAPTLIPRPLMVKKYASQDVRTYRIKEKEEKRPESARLIELNRRVAEHERARKGLPPTKEDRKIYIEGKNRTDAINKSIERSLKDHEAYVNVNYDECTHIPPMLSLHRVRRIRLTL